MKVKLISLFSAITITLIIVSCQSGSEQQLKRQTDALEAISSKKYISEGKYRSIKIVEVDGCQYIITQNAASGGITHKGNCNNKIHKQQKAPN